MESKEFNKQMTSGNNGFLHLFLNLALLVFFIWIVIRFAGFDCMKDAEGEVTPWILLPIVSGFVFLMTYILHLAGFITVQPNESRVLTFFGKYSGTVKENGFFWVNPFYSKEKLSLRAKNMDVEPIKVNDKNGNPVMIGLVLVWKISDTYKACFEVDSDAKVSENAISTAKIFDPFVRVQSDAALRKLAGLYAYDNMDRADEGVTLRSGGEEVNEQLENELRKHLEIAGIEVVEARINYLAYAAEIANSTRNARPPWSPTCWSCSAPTNPPHRSSTPARYTSRDAPWHVSTSRNPQPSNPINMKKNFALRVDSEIFEAIEKWAGDEFRSANGQIEWILSNALKKAGRMPKKPSGGKPKNERNVETS